MTTKEILDGYYESTDVKNHALTRNYVDNDILYGYEEEIGKQLIEMSSDELFELVFRLISVRGGKTKTYNPNHRSYGTVISTLKNIFNWYIVNVTPIINPFTIDKRFKGKEGLELFAQRYEVFSMEKFQSILHSVRRDFSEEKADYIELVCLLFYSGFANSQEIVEAKEEYVNWKTRTVVAPGRNIHLTDRAFELLYKFSKMDFVLNGKEMCAILPWHGSAFRFFVKQRYADSFQNRTLKEVIMKVSNVITVEIGRRYAPGVNYKTFYLLGFYDYLCKTYGKSKTNEIINSYYNNEDYLKLSNAALSYGIPIEKVPYVKRDLTMFAR